MEKRGALGMKVMLVFAAIVLALMIAELGFFLMSALVS
jgi:uncharacterized protein (UPF0333 family)